MIRISSLVAAIGLTALAGGSQPDDGSLLDPAFDKVPFESWLKEPPEKRVRWAVRFSDAYLSSSQRLAVRIQTEVDGNELVRRSRSGEFVILVQFSDERGRRFQSHGALSLKEANESARQSNFIFEHMALVRPGTYRVDLAMFDSQSGEHAAMSRQVRVPDLRGDPLPSAWDNLPPVEFWQPGDAPEVWFQPLLTGRLNIPVALKRPMHLEVLLNVTPTASAPRVRGGDPNLNSLARLLPIFKLFSQVELSTGDLQLSALDLTRRQVVFEQMGLNREHPLDWPRLEPSLLEVQPSKIDVRDLERRHENPQFFVKEIQRRIQARDKVLIVLSGPMSFSEDDDLHPVQPETNDFGKVYYLRYHRVATRQTGGMMLPDPRLRPGVVGRPNRPNIGAQEPIDQLVGLLKPLKPKLIEVYNPVDVRKAVASILRDLEKL